MKIRILCVLLLSGCAASTSQVVKIGPDTYTVGSHVRGGLTSWAEVKQIALQKANNHCDKMGQQMISSEVDTHGARGWTPQEAEVTFTCGPTGN